MVIHYLSISYVASFIIFLYLLYKYLRIFCKSPSSHCIQIFNQCRNNKKSKTNPISQVVIYKDRPISDDLTTSDSSEEAEIKVVPAPLKRNLVISSKSHNP
ncbi:unnamed protein product [Chilo suppressalis]|uniref:Uncharacterized protein n=1 Tax=Chilo suppressalis TaxID=168631 RepID=A0ABN8BHZ5_CHISP|nr:unnamed protein product [Chilo suppressalis]